MLIGGAAMTLIGLAVLLVEAGAANDAAGRRRELPWVGWMRRVSLPGAFLLGLSTFQAEFDFGVPQFRMIFHPMLIMLAASVSLVAARVWLGRGAALGAALFWLAMRGLMALLVGPILGEPLPHFPLYLVEALLVEAIALFVRRPLPLALASGLAIGTIGLAAEWGWTHVWMVLPWPSGLFPEGFVLGLIMALAGACVGAWLGTRLAADRVPSLRAAAVAGAVAIFALVGYGLLSTGNQGVRGTVQLANAGADRTSLSVRLDPRDGADGAEWFTATSWQGGGLVVNRLERVGPGEYRSTEPLPITGDWKTMLRLHRDNALTALPVYLPRDEAIPVPEIPAAQTLQRGFGPERKLLQRERKTAAGWLWGAAYGVVLLIALAFLVALVWGVHRVSACAAERSGARFGRSAAGRAAEEQGVDQQRDGHRAHDHREAPA
jgi:hypothetical protein